MRCVDRSTQEQSTERGLGRKIGQISPERDEATPGRSTVLLRKPRRCGRSAGSKKGQRSSLAFVKWWWEGDRSETQFIRLVGFLRSRWGSESVAEEGHEFDPPVFPKDGEL